MSNCPNSTPDGHSSQPDLSRVFLLLSRPPTALCCSAFCDDKSRGHISLVSAVTIAVRRVVHLSPSIEFLMGIRFCDADGHEFESTYERDPERVLVGLHSLAESGHSGT